MFKIFNLGEEHKHNNHDIEVEISDEDDIHSDDIGQVAVDIIENEDSLTIIAPLAGIEIDNINLSISQNIFTISGERNRPSVYDDDIKILVGECFYGPFSRSIILPENMAVNKIRATMENNLIIIDIPKLKFQSKTIKIDKLEG